MNDRQPLKTDRDLQKTRKNNNFLRQEDLNDTIHSIHIKVIKYALPVFVILFTLNLLQLPTWVNTNF
jgi:hypothetical protein